MTPATPPRASGPPIWRGTRGDMLARSTTALPLMGILNTTPDSFSDGGKHLDPHAALDRAAQLVDDGATMLDIGPESTRPGAHAVDEQSQIARAIPVIVRVRASTHAPLARVPISIDTTSAAVARAALDAGADAINDVSAMTADSAMLLLAAQRGAGVVLMHRHTTPDKDSYAHAYARPVIQGDAAAIVREFLAARAAAAMHAGVHRDCIMLDPGLGFGKTVEQNLALIRATPLLAALGFPVLSALSRKSFVGRVSLGGESTPEQRLPGTLALSLLHAQLGATILRIHDLREHAHAIAAWAAIASPRGHAGIQSTI